MSYLVVGPGRLNELLNGPGRLNELLSSRAQAAQ